MIVAPWCGCLLTSIKISEGPIPGSSTVKRGAVVVLANATYVEDDALGSHILHLMLGSPGTRRVYCLVRAQTPWEAHGHISQILFQRVLVELQHPGKYSDFDYPIICLPCICWRATGWRTNMLIHIWYLLDNRANNIRNSIILTCFNHSDHTALWRRSMNSVKGYVYREACLCMYLRYVYLC